MHRVSPHGLNAYTNLKKQGARKLLVSQAATQYLFSGLPCLSVSGFFKETGLSVYWSRGSRRLCACNRLLQHRTFLYADAQLSTSPSGSSMARMSSYALLNLLSFSSFLRLVQLVFPQVEIAAWGRPFLLMPIVQRQGCSLILSAPSSRFFGCFLSQIIQFIF